VVACEGARTIPQVGRVGIAENIADSFVRRGKLGLQRHVSFGLLTQVVEIFECAADEQFARGGRPGNIGNGAVDFEDEGVRKFADVVKAPLGDVFFAQCDCHANSQSEDDNHGGSNDRCMAANKFSGAI
jgi:hypothetical protein